MDTTREDVRLFSAKKWNFLRSTFENKLTPVSYTHLDVYKRQPERLIKRIRESGKFNQGFIVTELVASALTDMDIHAITAVSYTHLDRRLQQYAFDPFPRASSGMLAAIVPRASPFTG